MVGILEALGICFFTHVLTVFVRCLLPFHITNTSRPITLLYSGTSVSSPGSIYVLSHLTEPYEGRGFILFTDAVLGPCFLSQGLSK